MNLTEDFKAMLVSTITSLMDQINISRSLPDQKYFSNPPDPTPVVLDNRRDPPLDGGHSEKLVACGFSNMISSH